ncbi:uncharacterized protein OCT59_002752 [Rhizophagus irregularis]|nr:hypothetical protein OCT59_002752 [Rhizophagus irregularis]
MQYVSKNNFRLAFSVIYVTAYLLAVATYRTLPSHSYGLHLHYYSYLWNFTFAWLWISSPLLDTATYGTSFSHSYGLRLRCSPAIDSKKMGRIDDFWLKSLPRMKQHNAVENNEINAENVFLFCDLSCDLFRSSLQIGGTVNIIQVHKRSYRNGKQPIDEMIAIRRGKKQKPAETTIEDGKSQTPE